MALALPAGFLRNVGWQSISTFGGAAASFLSSLLLAKWLGAAGFGAMSIALGFATVVFQFAELRLHEPVIRYLSEYLEQGDAVRAAGLVKLSLYLDVGSGLLALTAALVIGALSRGLLYDGGGDFVVIALGAGYMAAWNTCSATSQGVLRCLGKFKILSIIGLANSVGKLAVTAFAVLYLGWSTRGVLLIAVVIALVANAITLWAALTALNERAPWREGRIEALRDRFVEMRAFVRNVWLLNLTMIPLKDLDIILLGALGTDAQVGAYRLARQFGTAVNLVFDPIYYTIYPVLARLWSRGERREMLDFIRRVTRLLAAGAGAVALVSVFAVPWVIRVFFGSSFDDAIPLFYALLPGVLVWAPLIWVPGLMLAASRSDLSLRAALVAAVMLLTSYAIAIPLAGSFGAALVWGIGGGGSVLISLWMSKRAGLLDAVAPAPAAAPEAPAASG